MEHADRYPGGAVALEGRARVVAGRGVGLGRGVVRGSVSASARVRRLVLATATRGQQEQRRERESTAEHGGTCHGTAAEVTFGQDCVVDSPALEILFQITMDSSDFGAGRSGCG